METNNGTVVTKSTGVQYSWFTGTPRGFFFKYESSPLAHKKNWTKMEIFVFSMNLTVFLFLNEKNCTTFGNHKIEKKILIYFYK
jgi:hypothetical protein